MIKELIAAVMLSSAVIVFAILAAAGSSYNVTQVWMRKIVLVFAYLLCGLTVFWAAWGAQTL